MELLGGPVGYRAFKLIQVVVEKVTGPWNDDQPYRHALLLQLRHEFPQLLDVAELVVFSMDQEQRFTARDEETKVVLFQRRADADQVRDAWIIYANV